MPSWIQNRADFSNTDLPYAESKTEVNIDRITAEAHPRTFERVPAGAKFKLDMVLNIFEGEDENRLEGTLYKAIHLLEDDYLGGNGSRGYGQVSIKIDKTVKDVKLY
jgi:CRISPR-associated protein Csm3